MPRRTKEELIIDRREKQISSLVVENKYFSNPIHHKNNYWSWAAWDSWAAQGKAGGCGYCANKHYNATLKNKRAKTKSGGNNEQWPVDCSRNICYECVKLVEKNIGVEFKRY